MSNLIEEFENINQSHREAIVSEQRAFLVFLVQLVFCYQNVFNVVDSECRHNDVEVFDVRVFWVSKERSKCVDEKL